MKQLDMTPEIEALIKAAVGPDVETTGFAVFEAIALNTNPLPGKNGIIFEQARVMPLTLRQMVDSINGGNSLPLMADHYMGNEPKGRAFHADLQFADDGGLEMRILFYLDPTETVTIAKLNSASLDEVSVSFMASQLLCSECGWDYFGLEASSDNIWTRTCANDHVVGTDGVHVQLVGLANFQELSLVARGAADKAKIVGKSQSKLSPPSSMRLAARGYEIESLICQARLGDNTVTVDTNKLMADLIDAKTNINTMTLAATSNTAALTAATEQVSTLTAANTQLTEKLALAEAKPTNEADYQVALAFLGEVLTGVLVASGATPKAEDLPKTVAELKAAIVEKTTNLTAILPVGGVSQTPLTEDAKPALVASAFTNRKLGSK